jgi:hypothetical protein
MAGLVRNNEWTACEPIEVSVLHLLHAQAEQLHRHALELAHAGGPQAAGVRARAEAAAGRLRETMRPDQLAMLDGYADNRVTLLIVEGMVDLSDDELPSELPELDDLKRDRRCLALASRNQILLNLAGNRAFAFDLDYNEMVRLVGNFKGGGKEKIKNEPLPQDVELSSHAGLALGPHTEPPYYCSLRASADHSPAPSTLILTARWNPLREPTVIIPIAPVLESLGPENVLALTRRDYRFTRPNSYVAGAEDGVGISILDHNEQGDYAFRFSAYRFTAQDEAPESSRRAIDALKEGVAAARRVEVCLDPTKAILINNTRALHCRDIIKDNRRILVRLFGYNRFSTALERSHDPILVKG